MKLFVGVAVLVAGCVASPLKQTGALYPGMNRAQVVSLMGQPHEQVARHGGEKLVYFGNTREKEYWVYLKNDRVTRFGTADDFRREATPDR